MRYPTDAVTARLLMRLENSEMDESGEKRLRYTATSPDGRCFEALDLAELARLYHRERIGRGWRIATA